MKYFEIRDKATMIPAFAFVPEPTVRDGVADEFLLRHCGWGIPVQYQVIFGRLDGSECRGDPYDWKGRTMPVAHDYIAKNWESLNSGDVIDVEFILGESEKPKESERL